MTPQFAVVHVQSVKPIRQADPERLGIGDTVEFELGKAGVIRAIQGFDLMLEQLAGNGSPAQVPAK